MDDLVKKYLELYEDMAESTASEKMRIFGNAEKWAFKKMVELSPKMAQCWLDKLEAIAWNNYLSNEEAQEIVATLVNQNGVKGAHWAYDIFKNAVESLGGHPVASPYYNCYALWVTANMLYSDHAQSVAEDMGYKTPAEVPNEKMALSMYKKAVEKLKDIDRPNFVRTYFEDVL
jgi:hypothetical protein